MSVFSKVYENQMLNIQKEEKISTFSTDLFIRNLFYTTVITSFSWEGDIPEFIGPDNDYIEESLFNWGIIGYFEDNGQHYIAPCYGNGTLMKNGLYDRYLFVFRNGEQVIKNYDEIELCFDNVFRIPSIIPVNEMVEKCVLALRTVDMLLVRAGLPSIKAIGDEQKIQVIVDKIKLAREKSDPYAIVSGDWVGNEVINIPMYDGKADDIISQWDIFVRYKNLFYISYGVSLVEISKMERLTQAEGQSNTEICRYSLFNDKYEHRKDWVERIKKKFNKTLKIKINRNFETVSALTLSNEEKIEMQKDVITPYREQNQENIEDKEVVDIKEGEEND